MFEHVGLKHFPEFFAQDRRAAGAGGRCPAACDRAPRRAGPHQSLVEEIHFPWRLFSRRLSEVLPVVEKTGLWVTDIEILRLHYAETLKAWRANFAAQPGSHRRTL